MDDIPAYDRYSYLREFFQRLLSDSTTVTKYPPIIADMTFHLAVLLSCNPEATLKKLPHFLSNENSCMQLVDNLPEKLANTWRFWIDFWHMPPHKRHAIEFFVASRVNAFLTIMQGHWIKERS